MLGLVVAIVAGLVIGLARGGSLANLAATRLRALPVVFVGVALQAAATLTERADVAWAPFALVLGSYACAFTFAGLNWRMPGMALIALGSLINLVVIAANQGMPVSPDALQRAGLGNPFAAGEPLLKGAHHPLVEGSRLTLLADVIPIRVSRNVVSAGDLVIWAGLLVLVQQLIVGRPGRRRMRAIEERQLSRP